MTEHHQMKPIAAGLASLGRGGDSMLVHMQPREVAGLQQLAMAHGGSLTVNPDTGLPEASFLGDVLGVVAPIALGAFLGPAGAAFGGGFMSPLAAGLTTGLLGYAITGDPLKGLTAGLGGYGGAGLGNALGQFGGTAAVSKVAEPALLGAAESAAPSTLASGLGSAPSLLTAPTEAASSLIPSTGAFTPNAFSNAVPNLTGVGSTFTPAATQAANAALAQSVPGAIVPNVGAGISKALESPLAFAKAYPTAAFTAASPLLAAATTQPQTQFYTPKEDKTPYEGPYVPTERQARFPTEEKRRQLGTSEYQYFNPVQPVPGYETYRGYEAGGAVNETPDPGSDTAEDARDADEYGLGGLAKFAEGGYTSSYDVPSTEYQEKYFPEKKQQTSYGIGHDFYGNSWPLYGPSNTVRGPAALREAVDRINSSPNPVLGFFGNLFQRAQPAPPPPPAWTPPQQPAPAPGLTPQYQGTGITTLPTAPIQRSPLLDMYTAAMLQGTPGFARGGYLDGPGDGMSDSIPATIADKQPARLADGEFVVPADVVSHLGNGSTKAGAKRLYAMMDKVRKARTGTTKQGRQINPNKYMPA